MKQKRFILMWFFLFASKPPIYAQEIQIGSLRDYLEDLGSVVMRDLPSVDETDTTVRSIPIQPVPHDLAVEDRPYITDTVAIQEDAVIRQPLVMSPLPVLSFQALNDGLTTIPPDTMGTVGINHLMTTLNDRVRIQTKMGLTLSTVSIGSFFGTTAGVFDPKIVYDPYNNRWVFVALRSSRSTQSATLIAVSQTDDPTGTWDRYSIKADPNNIVWADFPSLGFNSKWVVVQLNMFSISTNAFVRSHIYVIDKAKLYSGGGVTFKLFTLTNAGSTQAPATMYDNAHPTMYLLQNWNGNSNGQGYLRLYTINGAVGAETLTVVGLIRISNPWASSHPITNGGFAPQLGTTRRIMNGDSRIQSLIFRNNSLWAAQNVFLPASSPTHTGIQWLQMNTSGTIQQIGRIEDPFADLNLGTFFAYPSIAVNDANDALIGYSYFNPAQFASSGYSFRASTDALNTFRAPAVLRAGLDIYTKDLGSGRVRWGDYSNTITDPNGVDFWTIQESADTRTSTGTTRWLTWWGLVSPNLLPLPLAEEE